METTPYWKLFAAICMIHVVKCEFNLIQDDVQVCNGYEFLKYELDLRQLNEWTIIVKINRDTSGICWNFYSLDQHVAVI